jgi:hypothetical protein
LPPPFLIFLIAVPAYRSAGLFSEEILFVLAVAPWLAMESVMEELNGRMIACQILVTGLIVRVANDSKNPLRYLSDFRDEIHAVVRQVRIGGALDNERVREIAIKTVDELFSLMKPPNLD